MSGGRRNLTINLWNKQDKKCYLCGEIMFRQFGHPKSVTVDHVKPRFECVSHEEYISPKNKKAACYHCNMIKGRGECARALELRQKNDV